MCRKETVIEILNGIGDLFTIRFGVERCREMGRLLIKFDATDNKGEEWMSESDYYSDATLARMVCEACFVREEARA
jgi:hypothetical protein